jgi:hypothetical protein
MMMKLLRSDPLAVDVYKNKFCICVSMLVDTLRGGRVARLESEKREVGEDGKRAKEGGGRGREEGEGGREREGGERERRLYLYMLSSSLSLYLISPNFFSHFLILISPLSLSLSNYIRLNLH